MTEKPWERTLKPLGSSVSIILVPNRLLWHLHHLAFLVFDVISHGRLPVSWSLPRQIAAYSSLRPSSCHHPADFNIPEGNTSDTPDVSFRTTSVISIHLISSEEGFIWPHPWPYHHLKLSYQWGLKPRYHTLLSTSTFPISSLPLNPRVLSYEDLNSLDLSAVPCFLHIFFLLFLI